MWFCVIVPHYVRIFFTQFKHNSYNSSVLFIKFYAILHDFEKTSNRHRYDIDIVARSNYFALLLLSESWLAVYLLLFHQSRVCHSSQGCVRKLHSDAHQCRSILIQFSVNNKDRTMWYAPEWNFWTHAQWEDASRWLERKTSWIQCVMWPVACIFLYLQLFFAGVRSAFSPYALRSVYIVSWKLFALQISQQDTSSH